MMPALQLNSPHILMKGLSWDLKQVVVPVAGGLGRLLRLPPLLLPLLATLLHLLQQLCSLN